MIRRISSRKSWRAILALGLWASALLAAKAFADPESQRERHAAILMKALSYDEKIKDRAGQEMVVAVLYRSGSGGAAEEAEAWRQAFAQLTSLYFRGLPVRVLKVPVGNTERLRKAIAQEGIDALFVLDVSKDDLSAIQKVARENKVLTMASREEQVAFGLSIGVFVIDGKNTLIVNLPASREEGAVFSGEMLKLARVIK
jgi:hypothetical protein